MIPSSKELLYLPISQLKPYANNARMHSAKQVQQIVNSIKKFGFINPVIVGDKNIIIAGHGRYEAAKLLKLKEIPVIHADHLSETEIKAYRVADNKIALNSSWNNNLLQIELTELSISTELDIEITGFEMAEIDIIIDDIGNDPDPLDQIPEINDTPAITKLGYLYQLGPHILICGDSTKKETYIRLMGSDTADIVVTDPPYNVPIQGHVGGLGKVKHREFAQASGEMTDTEFENFLESYMILTAKFSKDGSIHYHFMDWRGAQKILNAGSRVYNELKNICGWIKDNGGMGSFYRSQHELVFVYKYGTKPHTNNIMLGAYGRYRTNCFFYPGVNTMKKNRMKELAMHPTVKPVAMIADIIKDASKRNDIVLDPFGGSGSTLIAAEKTGRRARLIEIDEKYCDIIIKRWQELTKQDAIHIESGRTFNDLSAGGVL